MNKDYKTETIDFDKIVNDIEDIIDKGIKKHLRIAKSIFYYYNPATHKSRIDIIVIWFGKKYRKFFNIKKYASIYDIVQDAVKWRDEKEEELKKPRVEERLAPVAYDDAASYSTGIFFREKGHKSVLRTEMFFVAQPKDKNNKYIRKNFSIEKLGKFKACEMACKFYRENNYFNRDYHLSEITKTGLSLIEAEKIISKIKKLMFEHVDCNNKYSIKISKYIYFQAYGKSQKLSTLLRIDNKIYQKVFNLSKYQPEEAYSKALLFRNKIMQKHNLLITEKLFFKAANEYFKVTKRYTNNKHLNYYITFIDKNGKRIHKYIADKEYGEARAMKIAMDFYLNNSYLGKKDIIEKNQNLYKEICDKNVRMKNIDRFIEEFLKTNHQYSIINKNTRAGKYIRFHKLMFKISVEVIVPESKKKHQKAFTLYPYLDPIEILINAVKWRNDELKKQDKTINGIKIVNDHTEQVPEYTGISIRHFEYIDDGEKYKLISVEASDKDGSILEAKLLIHNYT